MNNYVIKFLGIGATIILYLAHLPFKLLADMWNTSITPVSAEDIGLKI